MLTSTRPEKVQQCVSTCLSLEGGGGGGADEMYDERLCR